MGKFIVIIILAVGGWYAYQWMGGAPAVVAVDLSGDAGDTAGMPDFTDGAGSESAAVVNLEGGDVPEAFSKSYKNAEALWAQYTKERQDATLHDQAPGLAAIYSALLQETYNKPALKAVQLQIVNDRLTPLAKRLFFASNTYKKDESGLFVYHTLKDGELFPTVGREYGMSVQFINMMRGKDPQNEIYHVGEELKVVKAKTLGYFLHIDKSDFYMDAYVCGVFARRYEIGHGAVETATPTGETYIESRVLHPQWTNPKTNEVFEYGQEGHILGPVWMAFNKEIGKSGLGIHGYTGKGQATGARGSNGCIRMKNEDAIQLYNILVPAAYYKSGFQSRAPMRVRIVD